MNKLFNCFAIAMLFIALPLGSCSSDEPSANGGENTSNSKAVDLGLSVKWASCNVGASKPEESGSYFSWGETTTKADYIESKSVMYKMTITELRNAGIIDSNNNLTPNYDVATTKWGEPWRMPTLEEFSELVKKCKWQWTTQGEVNGYKVTGPNGNSIFLPAAGFFYCTEIEGSESYGIYGSSTAYDGLYFSYILNFVSSVFFTWYSDRYYGMCVRPVSDR